MHDLQHVGQRVLGLPVLLERVDANVARGRDVRVEDLGEEEALGRRVREVLAEHELARKDAALVGRAGGAIELAVHDRDRVVVARHIAHALGRRVRELAQLARKQRHDLRLELRRREGGGKVNGLLCSSTSTCRIFAAKCTKLQL